MTNEYRYRVARYIYRARPRDSRARARPIVACQMPTMALLLPLIVCWAKIASTSAEHEDTAVTVTVSVGASSPGRPLPHYWKKCFGSGHAALTLRQDWRDSLTAAVHELGLSGVRHHGLLDDDMGVVIGPPGGSSSGSIYNFSKISSSWDFQVALGVSPVVELSFMPAYLANCSWHAYRTGSSPPVDAVNPHGNGSCTTGNFYSGVNAPPLRWEDWYDLVKALASHAVQRYGLDVVKRWHFEVWYESYNTIGSPPRFFLLLSQSGKASVSVSI